MVRNGDIIDIDIPNRKLSLCIEDGEIRRRLNEWRPAAVKASGYLGHFASLVNFLARGATFGAGLPARATSVRRWLSTSLVPV